MNKRTVYRYLILISLITGQQALLAQKQVKPVPPLYSEKGKLMYTADVQGNISIEHESLKGDSMITAAAAKNSGGIVIAQVKRLAANCSRISLQLRLLRCTICTARPRRRWGRWRVASARWAGRWAMP